MPANRSEEEIAGYRKVLDTIHSSAPDIPFETPMAMDEIHERFGAAWNTNEHHRLLLVADYEVGRFISLEKLISDSRDTYYESLAASTRGWRASEHDIWPWTNYFLGVLMAAYKDFEARAGTFAGRGQKAELVKRFIRSSVSDSFTFDDVRQAAPGVSDVYIGKILRQMRDEGLVESSGSGRGARWKRLSTEH